MAVGGSRQASRLIGEALELPRGLQGAFFTTKAVGKGSGLGLSQVYGLATQSGGGVTIDTEVGKGTTIRVFLPRAHVSPARESPVTASASAAPEDNLTVLIVDDDDAVRAVTAEILVDLGYVVLEAGSGGAALDLFDQHPDIRAVLLDFAMPGMNGGDVARELTGRKSGLPILFATGYADADLLASTTDDLIVHKPIDRVELARKLAAALHVEKGLSFAPS